MNTFVKISKTIINAILTLIIIVGIAFIGLFIYGIQPYVVETGSMEPTLKTGSLCFVNKRVEFKDMKKGDIIAFKLDSGSFATHRIEKVTDQGFITKGDANSAVDNIVVTNNDFIGKNVFSIPGVGKIVKNTQTPSGKIILGTVVVVLFLAGILIGEPSKKKKKSSKVVEVVGGQPEAKVEYTVKEEVDKKSEEKVEEKATDVSEEKNEEKEN